MARRFRGGVNSEQVTAGGARRFGYQHPLNMETLLRGPF